MSVRGTISMLSRREFLRVAASGSVAFAAHHRFNTVQQPPDVSSLSLEEKIGQLFLLAFEGTSARDAAVLLGEHLVGSVYLSQDNLTSIDEALELMTQLQRIAVGTPHRIPVLAGCDQEGAWAVLTSSLTRGPGNIALGAVPTEQVEAMYRVFGQELKALGIAADLAPVCDVNSNPRNPIIGARSFGQNPHRVAKAVTAAVRGLHLGGARACAKHFPGHGDTSQDSHRGLATVTRSREQIISNDLVPFRAAIKAGVDIVMTAHLLYPAFDTEFPATLSPTILQGVLRKMLGFRGVILTDSFSMGAIKNVYGTGEAAIRALNAGADLIMLAEERYNNEVRDYLSGQINLIETVRKAVRDGQIQMSRVDEAVQRVLALKAQAGLFVNPFPDASSAHRIIGSQQNRDVALASARAAVVIPRNLDGRLPISSHANRNLLLISPIPEDAYITMKKTRGIGPNIVDPPTKVLLAAIKSRVPSVEFLRLTSKSDVIQNLERIRQAQVLVATENYPLPGFDFPVAPQHEVIDTLIQADVHPIVIGLRDPYELLDLPRVRTYLSALGYAPVCAQAAAEVLFGERTATGEMPTTVR